MNTNPARFAFGLFLIAGFMTLTANAGKVFKWIDERGTTHYSSRPPKIEVDTQVIDMSGVPDELFTENEPESSDDSKEKDGLSTTADTPVSDSNGERSADVIAYCQKVKDNLKILESEKRVRLQQEDGTIEILGNDAREREMKRLREQMEKFCL